MKRNTTKTILLAYLVLCSVVPVTCKKLEKYMFISTGNGSNITASSAIVTGDIIDLGNGANQHGHYYGKAQNLTSSDMKTQLGAPTAIGGFTSQLSNLEANTLYYIKAYITNGTETAYGEVKSFTTLQSSINPEYISSVVENATPTLLEMTYNLTLANVVPAASAFTIMVNSVTRTVSNVAISGTRVQLALASPVNSGDVVTVTYTKPVTNPLQTASGGQAASITAQSVTNNVAAAIPVYVSSVIENATPTLLEMTYSLTLANILPAAASFTVMVNSVARTVSNVVISGTKVQLTLASPVNSGDVVTVTYTKPVTNPLQTASGGQAASITTQSVTNNVAAAIPVHVTSVVENVTPGLLEMTYSLTLANILPATSSFIVIVNGEGNPVSNVAITGTKVQLTLANPVVYKDVISVSYNKPASNPIQTPSGGQVASITNQPVANNTIGIPVIFTTSAASITITTANSGGEIIDNGGASISNRGVCWSTTSNPTISDYHSDEGPGTGSFASFLTGLTSNSTYYFRAFATNSKGTGYGNELKLKTFTGTVKDIENNSYYTVTIGSQIWFASNLKTTRLNDGTAIATEGLAIPTYSWYNNNETQFKNTYGALYNWYTLLTEKICPTGWNVPTDADWSALINYLGGIEVAGGKIKEAGTVHWTGPNIDASNETGFTALPGGYKSEAGYFQYLGTIGLFSSYGGGSGSANYLHLENGSGRASLSFVQLNANLSVRCIKK